jgi:hypothetical protein
MSATGILPKVFVTAKTLSGFDLSPFIYEFKYEECMDKDNLFSISLIDTIKYKLIDNDELKIHDKLEISWGYAGDHRNERTRTIAYRYIGDIINREVTYKDSITLELELLCPTNKMKNNYFS